MPEHLHQIITDEPSEIENLTDDYTYRAQHSQDNFRGRPSPPPVLYYELADTDDPSSTTKRPFGIPLWGTAIFKPVSGRTIYAWVPEDGTEALLVMSTEDG